MPYQGQIQKQAPEAAHKGRYEEQFVPDQRSFGIPNSLMQAAPITPPPGMPNCVMREIEAEPGSGLFSGRGFAPSRSAYEFHHTVRRESVSRPVNLSVPDGTIQRDPTKKGSSGSKNQPAAAAAATAEPQSDNEILQEQVNEELERARSIQYMFQSRASNEWVMNRLDEQIRSEEDPEISERLTVFRRRLGSAIPDLEKIQKELGDVSAQLTARKNAGRAPLRPVLILMRGLRRRLDEQVALFNEFDRLGRNPNALVEDFQTAEEGAAEAESQPAAAASDAPAAAAAAAAPPSYFAQGVTPGASAEDTAAAGALPTYFAQGVTPGASAEDTAAAAAPPSYFAQGVTPGASAEDTAASPAPPTYNAQEVSPRASAEDTHSEVSPKKRGLFSGFFHRGNKK